MRKTRAMAGAQWSTAEEWKGAVWAVRRAVEEACSVEQKLGLKTIIWQGQDIITMETEGQIIRSEHHEKECKSYKVSPLHIKFGISQNNCSSKHADRISLDSVHSDDVDNGNRGQRE